MTQTIIERGPNGLAMLELPAPRQRVIRGVLWGRCEAVFTPAYWRYQTWLVELRQAGPRSYALGRTLAEEVAACLLGGHGIPAEVGLAAFERLRSLGLLARVGSRAPTASALATALRSPLSVGGRLMRYRFVDQKSRYLSEALRRIADAPQLLSAAPDLASPDAQRAFRTWLCTLPGIGPKTASWITRNWLGSDAVAIIDIHVYRAGVLAGVFRGTESVARDYIALEKRFLEFASAIGAPASLLDTVIWRDMRWLSGIARARLSSA